MKATIIVVQLFHSGKIDTLNSTSNLPQELFGLDYYKVITPYAFRQAKGLEAATKEIDDALAERLTGIDNGDRLIELSGVKFRHYLHNNHRVSK